MLPETILSIKLDTKLLSSVPDTGQHSLNNYHHFHNSSTRQYASDPHFLDEAPEAQKRIYNSSRTPGSIEGRRETSNPTFSTSSSPKTHPAQHDMVISIFGGWTVWVCSIFSLEKDVSVTLKSILALFLLFSVPFNTYSQVTPTPRAG